MIQLIHSDDISQQASVWVERQADGLSEKNAQLLSQWLAADPEHRLEFKAARAHWALVQAAAQKLAREPSAQSLPVRATIVLDRPLPARSAQGWLNRPLVRVAAGAGCFLALSLWLMGSDLHTGVGELKTVVLNDGSALTLNAGSAVDIEFTAQERRIHLRSGEIYVEVAKNPKRPFIVETEQGEARAVGTAFSVRIRDDAASVLVSEGVVDVSDRAGEAVRLSASQSVRVAERAGIINDRSEDDVRKSLAWREQRLFFSNVALAEFVAEMNRYSYRRMVIVDSDLSAVRVGGAFAAGDTPTAVTMLEAGFDVKAVQITPLLTLLYSANSEQVE